LGFHRQFSVKFLEVSRKTQKQPSIIRLEGNVLLVVSGIFLLLIVIASLVCSFSVPEAWYEKRSTFREELLNPPTFWWHILVQSQRQIKKQTGQTVDVVEIKCKYRRNYQPKEGEVVIKDLDGKPHLFPPHPFGTDREGRDVFLRTLIGARVYLLPSLIAALFSTGLGLLLGLTATDLWTGSLMKTLRSTSQCLVDALEAMPKYMIILLAIILIPQESREFKWYGIQWYGFYWLAFFVGVLSAPKLGKLIKEKVDALKEREFIEGATAMGLSKFTIAWKHILMYNCLPLFLTQAAALITEVILIEITLTYLAEIGTWGLGITVAEPAPSWGNILVLGRYHFFDGWWLNLFPISVVVLSISMIYLFGYSVNQMLTRQRVAIEL